MNKKINKHHFFFGRNGNFRRSSSIQSSHKDFTPTEWEENSSPVVTEGESALNFNWFEKSTAAPEEERGKMKWE